MKKYILTITLCCLMSTLCFSQKKTVINMSGEKYNVIVIDKKANLKGFKEVNSVSIDNEKTIGFGISKPGHYSTYIPVDEKYNRENLDFSAAPLKNKDYQNIPLLLDRITSSISLEEIIIYQQVKSNIQIYQMNQFIKSSIELENESSAYRMEITRGLEDEGVLPKNKLFNNTSNTDRFRLGGDIMDMKLVLSDYSSKNGMSFDYTGYIKVNWKIYDIKKSKVVLDTIICSASELQIVGSGGNTFNLLPKLLYNNVRLLGNSSSISTFIQHFSNENTNKEESIGIIVKKVPIALFASNSEMLKNTTPCVVTIKTELGHGSGFFISEDGYILTNFHVIDAADKIEVITSDGFTLKAERVSISEKIDVALLKVIGNGFKPIPLNVNNTNSGEDVFVIGTPNNIALEQTVTKGIVSAKRNIENINFIQTDASVNSGNSGGPILNTNGCVIAITTLKKRGADGIALGIAINDAIEALKIEQN
jgi:hypothetical protein